MRSVSLKIPNWPLTEATFREFITSLNDVLEFDDRRAGVSSEEAAPASHLGIAGDVKLVEEGGTLKLYGKGKTLGWKSVSLS